MKQFLILVFFIVGCGQDMTKTPPPPLFPVVSPSTVPALVPRLEVGTITGATNNEKLMIALGFTYANEVLASDCFKNLVLNAHFSETALSDSAIWQLMVSKSPVKVNVDMYRAFLCLSKVVGYENSADTVHMNRCYVNSAYMVGDNIMHEGMGHSIGFTHYIKPTMFQSEPYQMNSFYEQCFPLI